MDYIEYYKRYKKYKLKYKNVQYYGGVFGIDNLGDEVSADRNESDKKQDSFLSKDLHKKRDHLNVRQDILSRDLDNLKIINQVFSEYDSLVDDPKLKLMSSMRDIFNVKRNPGFNDKNRIPTKLDPSQWHNLEKSFEKIDASGKFNDFIEKLNPSTIYELLSKICIFSYADSYASYFNHLNPKSDRSCITGTNKSEVYTEILLCTMLHLGRMKKNKKKTCETKGDESHCHYSKTLNLCLPKYIKPQENTDKKKVLKNENIPKLLYNTIQTLKRFAEADYIIGQFLDMTQDKSNKILIYWDNVLKMSKEKLKNIKYLYKICLDKYNKSKHTENEDKYKRYKMIYEEIISNIDDYQQGVSKLINQLKEIDESAIDNYTKKISEWSIKKDPHNKFPNLIKIDKVIFALPDLLNKDLYYSNILKDNITIPNEILNIWRPMVINNH